MRIHVQAYFYKSHLGKITISFVKESNKLAEKWRCKKILNVKHISGHISYMEKGGAENFTNYFLVVCNDIPPLFCFQNFGSNNSPNMNASLFFWNNKIINGSFSVLMKIMLFLSNEVNLFLKFFIIISPIFAGKCNEIQKIVVDE